MRELKYRARHGSTWHYFTLRGLVVDAGPYYWLNNPDTIIDEFTGLKDKTGREIYEGDIVISGLTGNRGKIIVTGYAFRVKAITGQWGGELRMFEFNNLEVIGNMYENPELLSN